MSQSTNIDATTKSVLDPKRDANVTAGPNGKEVQMNRAYEQVPQINAPASTTSEEASKTAIVNDELRMRGKNSAVDKKDIVSP